MRMLIKPWALLALSLPLGLCPISSLAAIDATLAVTAGGITQNYHAVTTAPNALAGVGARATLQFSGNADCFGLACLVDGPAVGAYITSNAQTDMADSAIRYNFSVVGAPAAVPILVSGMYQTVNPDELPAGAGGTLAAAILSVLGSSGQLFSFTSSCYNYPPEFNEDAPEMNCGSGTYRGTFTAAAGSTLTVGMRAIAFRKYFDAAPGPASAFIDPFFQIDPVFAATHPGYSLSFDAGVANATPTAPVPEPQTLALMMVGLIAIAIAGRRRSDASLRSNDNTMR